MQATAHSEKCRLGNSIIVERENILDVGKTIISYPRNALLIVHYKIVKQNVDYGISVVCFCFITRTQRGDKTKSK